ncbi:MAG: NCS2 family permease [Rhodobiaceae bacterium]|jgi:AGZA family xanthine/uracil permease-like MFS transporter
MNRFFGIDDANTSVRRELLAGLSTFLTMSFIIAVNPVFLADAGIPFAAGFVATVLATAIGTAIMALWAKWPVAVAPGMGLNAYFAYGLVLGQGFSWQQALTAVFVASLLFFLFSLSRIRGWLISAIPASLRAGITAGIGLFLAMIGLQGMGLVVDDPDTLLRLGSVAAPELLLALVGLLVMAGLAARGIHGGILITILGLSLVGWISGLAEFGGIAAPPPVASAALSLDFSQLASFSFLTVVFVLFFLDFFDTTGTLTGIADLAGKRRDDGSIENLDRAVLADTGASVVGSLLGTSSMTTYLESATGLRAGGRTGLTALTVAALFLLCLFFEPLFASIPPFATAPALVFVAAGFLAPLAGLDWDDMVTAVPVMLMAVLMPLTFSIAAGIAVGFIAHVAICLLAGRGQQVNAGTWVITIFGMLWLATPLIGG